MASTNSALLLLLLVALAGLADAARPVDAAAAKHPVTAPELDGMMECFMGCFTTVMSCATGCMGKGTDMPLCIITCDQQNIVCMVRCGLTPSPPGPKPLAPPKPPSPPKLPAPAPGTPYAAHNTETSV
ncbi:unnamed protein product [Alopecurus aequalis]